MIKVKIGVNDLETWCKENNREDLLEQWHPTKNGDLRPIDVTSKTSKKVWWYLPYDDSKTGKHFDFEWDDSVNHRTASNVGCPYLNSRRICYGFNDLETWCKNNGKEYLLEQWHPTKNGELLPRNTSLSSSKKVWWYLPYDDPETGKHFDFEWEAAISNRVRGANCPFLENSLLYPGYNDFATKNPQLLNEWDYTKNKVLPSEIFPSSKDDIWWKCENGHSYQMTPETKKRGYGCPICSNRQIIFGYNDFATLHPDLMKEWNYEKNKIQPSEISEKSGIKVWWKCKDCGYEWKATPHKRCYGRKCPKCATRWHTSFPEQAIFFYIKQIYPDAVNSDNHIGMELDIFIPSISKAIEYDGEAWHSTNKKDRLDDKKNQLCKENNIELIRIREPKLPKIDNCTILVRQDSRTSKSLNEVILEIIKYLNYNNVGISVDVDRDTPQILEQYSTKKIENSLENCFPDIAAQWHPTLNGNLTPTQVSQKSGANVWWLCTNGHSYQMKVHYRTVNNLRCPICNKEKKNLTKTKSSC